MMEHVQLLQCTSCLQLLYLPTYSAISAYCKQSLISGKVGLKTDFQEQLSYSIKNTPLGDKVSMLIHIYPHIARRKIEVIICKITRLTAHFMCGLMSDLLICTCL